MVEAATFVYYGDDDANGHAIKWARNPGVDIVTANEADMRGAKDEDHFTYAIKHAYVLITGNIRDFRPMYAALLESGDDHSGVVFITPANRTSLGYIAEKLHDWQMNKTAQEMKNLEWWI